MIIDTSALVAIILLEAPAEILMNEVRRTDARRTSAPSLLEAGMILRGRIGVNGITLLYTLIDDLRIEVVPFDDAQARLAIDAFARYGKGMGHKAQLNFGDCAVYALAKMRSEPLLALGNDFIQTDLQVLPAR